MVYCTLQTTEQEVYGVLYTADCSTGSIWCIVLQTVEQEVYGVLYTADFKTGSKWCIVHCRL